MPALKFQVQETIFDSKSMLDEQNFYHQKQGGPSELTKTVTYIMGKYNNNYPISMMTLGSQGFGGPMNRNVQELDDIQYTYPVMGRDIKVSVVAKTDYAADAQPGRGHGLFDIYFADNWLKRFYIIQSENGVQAYIHEDPTKEGNLFRYRCQLDPADAEDFCPMSELQAGARWIELNTAAAESESRTTESNMVLPGNFKNQMTVLRHGMSWAGNAANKVMRITLEHVDGSKSNYWMDAFMWYFEKAWLDQLEHTYWYSRYNRQMNGDIPLKDILTGKVIPRGSGILEQILNKGTYTRLTYDDLQNKIGDALFGQSDTAGMSITLYTGTGGFRELQRAMLDRGISMLTSLEGVADKFVTGTGYHLMLGGFFDGFYHVDGYTIKVKKNPVFDLGKVAAVSPRHPESGLPLESYRMVFIDDNDSNGQPNIKHVAQKGRAFLDGVVKGLTPMPRSLKIKGGGSSDLNSALLSTDQDKSAYTRLATTGVQMLRGNRSFDLQCVMGIAA